MESEISSCVMIYRPRDKSLEGKRALMRLFSDTFSLGIFSVNKNRSDIYMSHIHKPLSELLKNAYDHGQGDISFHLGFDDNILYFALGDQGFGPNYTPALLSSSLSTSLIESQRTIPQYQLGKGQSYDNIGIGSYSIAYFISKDQSAVYNCQQSELYDFQKKCSIGELPPEMTFWSRYFDINKGYWRLGSWIR